jgi:hypothetical protein
MPDPIRRISSWNAKTKPERVKATLDDMQEDMRTRYEKATMALWATDKRVKEVLAGKGVQTIQYVPYLSYGRQLYKLSREKDISGESLKLANKVLHDKWHSRGLDEAVLAAIAKDVFDVAPL